MNELPITSTPFYWVVEALVDHSLAISILTETESTFYRVVLGQSASQEKKITAFKITRSFPGHCPICQGGFVICLQRALENLVFLSRSNIRALPVLFLGFLRQVLLLSPGFLLPQYSEYRTCRCAPLCLACSFISHCHVLWHANVS